MRALSGAARALSRAVLRRMGLRGLRVYVAAPYSSAPEENTLRAIDAADRVLARGHYPYVPHLNHYWHARHPHGYAVWTAMDLVWLVTCDVLLRLPGRSPGASDEAVIAEGLGIPVIRSPWSLPALSHGVCDGCE